MTIGFKFTNASWPNGVDLDDVYVRADYFRTGGLYTAGTGTSGQLGNSAAANSSVPVNVPAGSINWRAISSNTSTNLAAIKSDGTLWTWGNNVFGQLGDNTNTNKSSPVQTVAGGNNWKQVSAGQAVGAIKSDGTLWTWGLNSFGSLGDNSTTNRSSPVQTVAGGNNWKQVSSSAESMAAIKLDGTLWTWGQNTGDSIAQRSSPAQTVAGGTTWKFVAVGKSSAAIKTDGTLWTWGDNSYGGLGDNTVTYRSSPVQTVAGGNNWKTVSALFDHIAAIKTDGTLWVWGKNNFGQLGDNTQVDKSSPVQTVAGGNNWKSVSAGSANTAAVKSNGTIWAVGYNGSGSFGLNNIVNYSSPVQCGFSGNNWKSVAIGVSTLSLSYE
jgi:alpha-tubulin suppressor-like RCC1 family protein